MRDLTGPLGQPEAIGDFLVRQLLQIAQHHRGAQRDRQGLERLAELARRSWCSACAYGPASGVAGCRSFESTSRAIVCRSFRTLR
jgi:hypothetical protein